MLELDEQQLEIYNDITMLVNEIEDLCMENLDLKSSLDRLRKNLNNTPEITSLVVQINEQIYN
jgi:regulator of replication initiation timing